MRKESKIQLDSSKLLGFKQLKADKNDKLSRLQAMVGSPKVGGSKPPPPPPALISSL